MPLLALSDYLTTSSARYFRKACRRLISAWKAQGSRHVLRELHRRPWSSYLGALVELDNYLSPITSRMKNQLDTYQQRHMRSANVVKELDYVNKVLQCLSNSDCNAKQSIDRVVDDIVKEENC